MRKRLITAVLSCLLATSLSITSLADGLNGGGSGSSQQPSTIEYIASHHAYQVNNGIQCSIVRKDNGQLVSNIVTLVNYIPTQIGSAPEGDLKKYWNQYINRTGILNTPKNKIQFLCGPMKDTTYTFSIVDFDSSKNDGWGVCYYNNDTGEVEEGKMYTYADIETALKLTLDKYYTQTHPEYAEAYQAAGGSPIDPAGGVYPATNTSKKIIGPVDRINGYNVATGDTLRDQMNTKLPDGTIVLQHLADMKLTKTDGLGNFKDGVEPLFHFTNPDMQARYDELVAQNAAMPLIQVMIENNLYLEVEAVAWQSNEVVNPQAPAGYNKTGLTNEQFWNSPVIYFGTPRLITFQTSRDLVSYISYWKNWNRAYDNKKDTAAFDVYMKSVQNEVGKYYALGDNTWIDPLLSWYRKTGTSQAWDWSLAYQAYSLEKSEPQIGLQTFADLGIDKNTVDRTIAGTLSFWLEHLNDLGYGVMLFSPVPEGSTSTFDEINYSSSSTNGYRPGPSEDKSKDGGTEAKNNIVKFYATKTGDSYVYTENHTRSNTVGSITLEDEEGYVIDNWYTSSTFKEPTNKNDSYDNWKSSMENKQTGNKTGTATLPQGDTLYLRLVEAPVVIKVYETGGTVDKVTTDTNPKFDNNKLIVTTPDNGYTYTEGVKSNTKKDVKDWSEVPSGTPTTDTNIPLSPNEKVVYLHYYKDPAEAGLVLHENEISHQFTLSNVKGYLLDGIRKYSSVSVSGSCPEDVGHKHYRRCGSPYVYQNSDDWTYTIENVPSYNTQFVWKWLQTDQKSYSGNGLSQSGGEGHSTPDLTMILQRSISDKATLYPNKNSDEATLKEMGLQGASYTPANQRNGGADQKTRKQWTETFTTNWQFTAHNDPTAYFETDHGYTKTDTHTNSGNEAELNSAYSQAGNTLIYGLWGQANNGNTTPSTKAEQFRLDGANEASMKMKSTFEDHSKFMCFYPYYRMKYIDELNESEKQAYLTSENLSKMSAINRVDVSVAQTQAGIPLDLTSTQWSIHRGAQTLLSNNGIGDKNSLLPSGAIYNLALKGGASDGLWVKFRTYQTAVDDADKVKLEATSDMKVLSEAKSKSNTFKEQVKRVLDNYEVVLLGSKGLTDEADIKKNGVQITGSAKKNKPFGAELASDDKYKLEAGNNNGKANASDLDILNTIDYEIIWKLEADADGNVIVYKNGSEVSRINKTQGVSQLISGNNELQVLDDRTKAVTNFIASLDRNLGSDRSGRTWYNEGFDSILVYEHDFAFLMGFGNNAPTRSAALNIKLNGYLKSRQEMFTGDDLENTARTFQFRTSKKSVLPEAQSKPDGWVGDFEGLTVVIPQVDSLLTTKLFYTSNTTVMDLN